MTLRALSFGVAWALFICSFTYYNNQILGQTFFVSHHLPIGVFGVLLLLLGVNPLWRKLRPGLELAPRELAVMVMLALSICSWPDVGGFRIFTTALSYPNHMYKLEAGWQGAGAMSYVPGGSPLLAEGFVSDFDRLKDGLTRAPRENPESLRARVAQRLPPGVLRQLETAATPLRASERRQLLGALNQLIEGEDLRPLAASAAALTRELERLGREHDTLQTELDELRHGAPLTLVSGTEEQLARLRVEHRRHVVTKLRHRINREVIRTAFSEWIAPPVAGSGVILADGYDDPFAVGALVNGWSGGRLTLAQLPWDVWWPTLRLWGTFAVLLVLAMLCLSLIVHPQWAERELLPYPIVAFLRDVLRLQPSGAPELFGQKLFWGGLVAACMLNLVNGLHSWLPWVPEISKTLDFSPVRDLYPRLSQVGWTTFLIFQFTLYPMVIAFTYFVRGDVGLSLGISNIVWTLLGVVLIGAGVDLGSPALGLGADQMVRIGATIGFAGFILYTGRHYYRNVVAAALGFARAPETPAYSVWAARSLLVATALMVWLLEAWAGLHWSFALTMIGGILVSVLVIARVNAEGGMFMFMPGHSPFSLIQAVLGLRAIAPAQYFTLSLLNTTFWIDPRGAAMPFFTTGLHASESVGRVSPRKSSGWLALLVLVGFLATLAVTFMFQYNLGVGTRDTWAREGFSRVSFDNLTRQLSVLGEQGALAGSMSAGLVRLHEVDPDPEMLAFTAAGFVFVIVFGLLRLRVPSWPLHPILLVGICSWAVNWLAPSILLGWIVRTSVIQLGGSRGYRQLKPLMTGVIAGELLSGIGWIVVGALYYALTGLVPSQFSVFVN
jgi:hypothetical protein